MGHGQSREARDAWRGGALLRGMWLARELVWTRVVDGCGSGRRARAGRGPECRPATRCGMPDPRNRARSPRRRAADPYAPAPAAPRTPAGDLDLRRPALRRCSAPSAVAAGDPPYGPAAEQAAT